jgi:flagellin FlaB
MMGCRKIRRICKLDTASIGIGAMIVFIAMVLVAGIAASVLVQTSTRLEMQALRTGQETIAEVSSGLKIEAIEGHNTSGSIDKMAIEITSKAGAPDIDLAQTVIELSDSNDKFILTRGETDDYCNSSTVNGDLFANGKFGDATNFGITVLQDADESCTGSNPIINFGDHVVLGVNTDSVFTGLDPRTDVSGLVICEEGSPGIIGFTTPASYIDPVMELQ